MTSRYPPAVTPPGQLHPRHGPHNPSHAVPPRAVGSVRRTSTIDSVRPDGPLGRVEVRASARDLRTGRAGSEELGRDALTVDIDFPAGRTITAIRADPGESRLSALIGASAGAGFRARVEETVPEEVAAASRLHLLLDDLPTATLVGGYALGAASRRDLSIRAVLASRHRPVAAVDLCAGWRADGTIMVGLEDEGMPPVVTGPPAPSLDDDPLGWHDMPPLPPHGMRRARLLDVLPTGPDTRVFSLLRDSHVDEDGVETVVHEYVVHATVREGIVIACTAEPRVLPFVECPSAAASAGRLVGRPLLGLRPEVRARFIGVGTCTHLNDQLRSLADVPRLLAALGED